MEGTGVGGDDRNGTVQSRFTPFPPQRCDEQKNCLPFHVELCRLSDDKELGWCKILPYVVSQDSLSGSLVVPYSDP